MQNSIDINIFKEKPDIFFSQLTKEAKIEINDFLTHIVSKYHIQTKDIELKEKSFLLPRPVKKFEPLKRSEIYAR